MQRTPYRYPKTGPSKYQVLIAENGEIHVERGDWLSKYSMCIHGTPYEVNEYARMDWDSSMKTIVNVDLIYEGETIYHLPTRNKRRITPGPRPEFDKSRRLAAFFRREANIPKPRAEALSEAILRARLASTAALIGEVFGIISLGGGSLAASLVSPIGGTIASMLSLLNAAETGYRIDGQVGYCYGFTAWAFGEPKPGYSQKLLKNSRDAHGIQPAHEAISQKWWTKFVAEAFRQGPIAAEEVGWSVEAYRVLLQSWTYNDPAEFSREITKLIASQIKNGTERNSFLNTKCVYNL